MKLIDRIRQTIGDDKLLHFLVGALVTAWGFIGNVTAGVLCFFLVITLSYVKEMLDDSFSFKDIGYALLGGLISSILTLIIQAIW